MSVKLTFDFDSVETALKFLMKHTEAPTKVEEAAPAKAEEVAPAKAEKPAKGKGKGKSKGKAAKEIDGEELNAEDARAALTKVSDQKGIKSARNILKAYNAERLSELKVAQYPAFIQACEGVLE